MNWVFAHVRDTEYGTLTCLDTEQSFLAISGPWGKGKAPAGVYEIEEALAIDPDPKTSKPFRDEKGFAWFARLRPMFQTERSGFGIHPDGGVDGTLGCIGIRVPDTFAVFSMLTNGGMLYVLDRRDYSLPGKGVVDSPA